MLSPAITVCGLLLACSAGLAEANKNGDASFKQPPPAAPAWLRELLLRDENGGTGCAVCSVLSGLMQQLAEIHNTSVAHAMDKFCGFLPEPVQGVCRDLVEALAPELLVLLEERETPDVICHAVGLCRNDTGQFCRLFPPPKLRPGEDIGQRVRERRRKLSSALFAKKASGGADFLDGKLFIDICDVFKPICDTFTNHTPLQDQDGDMFSTMGTFRGYFWRGKDCNDKDAAIYPGRHTTDDSSEDTNCNGIFGVEPNSGKTYESLWCNGTGQVGTVVLGDSASAHFHIPPAWLTSREMSPEAYQDLMLVLENEFDWPMMSGVTGFTNSTWPTSISGAVDSIYNRLVQQNLCNHRDYQNIAVNGANAKDMAKEIVKSFVRRGPEDNPVFLFLSLIGNDVCTHNPGTDHMTKPDDFYKHTLETLTYLDQHIAPGSWVLAMGLVDGRVLYDTLSDKTHPVGSLHDDVTYAQVYDYLNCLQISPCYGWMNSNETMRNLTTERAEQLNIALKSAVTNNTFKNFNVMYVDPPIHEAIKNWKKMGRDPQDLIEPVDGFHPSQVGQSLTTQVLFEYLESFNRPLLPLPNPNNQKIREKFGDQGGYRG